VAFHFPKEGPAEFFDSFGRAPETYHRRFRNVLIANEPQYKFTISNFRSFDSYLFVSDKILPAATVRTIE
jgi:hypothetical protein